MVKTSIFNYSRENKSDWCITLSFKIFKKISKAIFQKNTNDAHNAYEQCLTKVRFHLENYLSKVV